MIVNLNKKLYIMMKTNKYTLKTYNVEFLEWNHGLWS